MRPPGEDGYGGRLSGRSPRAGDSGGVHCEEACSVSLFWRIFLLNAAVLVAATALLLGPATVSAPVLLTEALIMVLGLV